MTDYQNCWNAEEEVKDLGIEVPRWIEQDISPSTIASICQGGCASGAYMPAVTYWQAGETMQEYGDSIFEYLEEVLGEIPNPVSESWLGRACDYMSLAVELWASSVIDEVESILEENASND